MKHLILLASFILITKPALAYIDPGIGAMFIQGLIASLMVIVLYAKKIIAALKNAFKKNDKDKKDSTDE